YRLCASNVRATGNGQEVLEPRSSASPTLIIVRIDSSVRRTGSQQLTLWYAGSQPARTSATTVNQAREAIRHTRATGLLKAARWDGVVPTKGADLTYRASRCLQNPTDETIGIVSSRPLISILVVRGRTA